MNSVELQDRIRTFGNLVILAIKPLLKGDYAARSMSGQVIRSATSAGANYRAACRSKSPRDFINKLKIVEEELDETEHWLTTLGELRYLSEKELYALRKEANELLAIIVRSIVTARRNLRD